MIKGILSKVFGTRHERERKRVQPIVDAVNEHFRRLQSVSEEELHVMEDIARRLEVGAQVVHQTIRGAMHPID